MARGATIERYPAAKDETDLELALLAAVERGATWIRMLGAIGGPRRPDARQYHAADAARIGRA